MFYRVKYKKKKHFFKRKKKVRYMNVTLGSNNNILESLKGGSLYGKVHSLREL